jgi:hypothetical protein
MDIELGQVLRWVSDLGVIGLLLIIIWSGHRRLWVWGWQLEAAERREDEWRQMALKGTEIGERVIGVVEKERGVR